MQIQADYFNLSIVSCHLHMYRGIRPVFPFWAATKGHVILGVGGENFRRIRELPKIDTSPFAAPAGNERAVWVAPVLCCTVKYMEKTESGYLRQPVFKGLREDKLQRDLSSIKAALQKSAEGKELPSALFRSYR